MSISDILLVISAILFSLVSILGDTWREREKNLFKKLTFRGWVAIGRPTCPFALDRFWNLQGGCRLRSARYPWRLGYKRFIWPV